MTKFCIPFLPIQFNTLLLVVMFISNSEEMWKSIFVQVIRSQYTEQFATLIVQEQETKFDEYKASNSTTVQHFHHNNSPFCPDEGFFLEDGVHSDCVRLLRTSHQIG